MNHCTFEHRSPPFRVRAGPAPVHQMMKIIGIIALPAAGHRLCGARSRCGALLAGLIGNFIYICYIYTLLPPPSRPAPVPGVLPLAGAAYAGHAPPRRAGHVPDTPRGARPARAPARALPALTPPALYARVISIDTYRCRLYICRFRGFIARYFLRIRGFLALCTSGYSSGEQNL
ncbi:hypothetical protein DFH09DRAFT_1337255 [Mycena vulgaris]|nr:hypothetical protein DFH09DRAFT_1337255 [Mycena vulgaris]